MSRRPFPMRWTVSLLLWVAAALALVACSRAAVPDTTPSIRGVVTSTQATDAGGTMRVVWTDDPVIGEQLEFDAAQIAVTADTTVLRRMEGQDSATAIEFGDIRVGDVVEAWFTGPLLESYPVQAGASHVLVIGRYDGELPEPPGLEAPLE